MEDALAALKAFVSAIETFEVTEVGGICDYLEAVWKQGVKPCLQKAGETGRYLYFVLEGVQRGFYAADDGREATIVFTYPVSFPVSSTLFFFATTVEIYAETLTSSRFIRTEYRQIAPLWAKYHSIETFNRKALSVTLSGTLQRQIELQCFSAEEKFRALLKRSPHVLQLIPHKYLASYLGLDATTF